MKTEQGQLAPIILFAFDRPLHLKKTLAALADNELAAQSDLTIYCDGPRHARDMPAIQEVLSVANRAAGFHSCTVIRRERNWGLAQNIISGVSEQLDRNDRVIVLEDDLITSPYFLRYMNDGLKMYATAENVASIHGWCFPNTIKNQPETFFLRGTDCWGWATWKRAWELFEPDAALLLRKLKERNLEYAFNCNGTYDYIGMLQSVREGKVNSWAVRWRATAFLHGLYSLHPGRSLVRNLGIDGSGTHCGVTDIFDVPLSSTPIEVRRQPVQENSLMRGADMAFHSRLQSPPSPWRKLWRPLRSRCPFLPSRKQCKAFVKDLLPPLLLRHIKKCRRAGCETQVLTWEGDYPDWASAVAAAEGYDSETIFLKVRDAARAVRDGNALWERDSVLFNHEEYNIPLLGALMSAAAWNRGRLRVLDFGGAFGSTFWQHRALLDALEFVSWNVVEQPRLVACGREEFQTARLRFWPDMVSCAAAGPVDVVLFSSVLQYVEDPYALLEQAIALAPVSIILDRTPFADQGERITVQHVPESIYRASYACRWLDRARVIGLLEGAYHCLPPHSTHIDSPGFSGIVAIQRELHAEAR